MPFIKKVLPDLLLVGGAAAVAFGVWTIYPPAGYIVGGALAIVAGMKLAAV